MPDVQDFIDYENGDMDYVRTIEFFQKLVNSGQLGNLQGHYGRTAQALIDNGDITAP